MTGCSIWWSSAMLRGTGTTFGAVSIVKDTGASAILTSFPRSRCLSYHNDGNGRFTEVTHRLGLDKPAKALGIAVADFDRDGRTDIYVANDSMPEFLFHQKADGTYEEVAWNQRRP